MKTKIYLIALLLLIMGAGARTMFEIAYQGMAFEHDNMSKKVSFLIGIAVWFVLMMVADVLIITNAKYRSKLSLLILISLGVFIPVVYMFINR